MSDTLTSRIAPGYREAIDYAWGLIPAGITDRIHPHFLTGVDPRYVGLHDWPGIGQWSSSQVAHANCVPRPVVVLPLPFREMERLYWNDPGLTDTIIHELGHILDYALPWRPTIPAVSEYGETNGVEAFAEAFSAWVLRPDVVAERAPVARALFMELAA